MKRAAFAVLCSLLAISIAQAKPPAKAAKPAEPPPPTRELQILQRVMPSFDSNSDGGCVTVEFVIKHDGFVGDVTVLEARPESLADPTVAALKQWMFQSFPPPDLTTVQTFQFAPEQVRLPDNAIRSPYLVLSGDGALKGQGCGAGKKDDKAGKPGAKG